MWSYLVSGLGWIIEQIYSLVNNYGVAIIIFTVVIKMILLPLNIKSQHAMKKQQKIQPLMAELQKKYANDQEKLQREMMKVYKENNVSMSAGCLPTLIQMPILVALYQVIRMPLSYLKHVDWSSADVINRVIDLQAQMADKFPQELGKLASASMENLANMYQIQLSKWSTMLGQTDWSINFNFLGLDLGNVPTSAFSYILSGNFSMESLSVILLLLIPILAVSLTVLTTKITQKQSGQNKKSDDQAAQMNKSMTLMMPIMTGFFTLTLPAGLGVYWITSSAVQILQQLILNKIMDKKEDDFVVKIPEKHIKNNHGKKRK